MPILWNIVLDELEKVGAIDEEEARRALDRLDTLDRNKLTGHQVARYALLGGVSAPVMAAIADTIEGKKPFGWSTAPGGKQQALRSIAATAVKGAIGTGLIPLVRSALDRNAEKSKLKSFVGALDMPKPEELAPPKLGFATSEYNGPTGGGGGFNLVSDLPNKPPPSLKAPVMKTAKAIPASQVMKEAMVTRIPGGRTPGGVLRSARSIGREFGRDLDPDGLGIGRLYKSQKGRGSGGEIFGAKAASAIPANLSKTAYTLEEFKKLSPTLQQDYMGTSGASGRQWGRGEHGAPALAGRFPGAKGPIHTSPAYRAIQAHYLESRGTGPIQVQKPSTPMPLSNKPLFAPGEEVSTAKAYHDLKQLRDEMNSSSVQERMKPLRVATERLHSTEAPTMAGGLPVQPSAARTVADIPNPANSNVPISTPIPAARSGVRAKSPLEVLGKTPGVPQKPIGRLLPAKPLALDMSELHPLGGLGRSVVPRPVPSTKGIAAGLAKAVGHHLGGIHMLRDALTKIATLETNPGTVETGRQGDPEDYVWTQDVGPEAAGTTNSGRAPGLETGHSDTEKSVSHETIGLIRGLFTNYQNAARADKEQVADLFESGRNGYYVTRNPTLMDQVKRVVGRKLGAKKQVLVFSTCFSPTSSSTGRGRGCRACLRRWG